MALANRVYVSTISTGTGTVTPGAKVSNAFTSFATANAGAPLANGDYTYELNEGLDFEVGNGTWDGSTLTRNVVYISSIAGVIGTTKMTLAGSATIQVVAPAEAIANLLSNNTFTGLQAITPASQLAAGTSALTITATQPTTPVTAQSGIEFLVTGAGSASQNSRALNVQYLAGYTGSNLNMSGRFLNSNAGTGATLVSVAGTNAPAGNVGVNGLASGVTAGLNVGSFSGASGGDTNVAVLGLTQGAKNNAKNIGVVGSAINTGTSPVQIGGWFSLNQTTVPTVSAALIADNGSQTDPIARFRDNGTDVFVIADGGAVTISATLAVTGASTLTGNVGVGGANSGSYGVLEVTGSGYQAFAVRSTSGVVALLAANSNSEVRLGAASNHPVRIYTNNVDRGGVSAAGAWDIPNTTASSSTTTGALIVGGGVGVGGALNVAGVSSAAGLSSSSYVRAADGASIGWGALSATIVGNSSADVFVFYTASTERMRIANTQISISSTTASSSTTTGALIVGGGVGVGGSIYAGASIIGAGIYSTGAMKCSHPTAGLGYDTGAGGTVTQATNRTTGVTLNKSSGAITLFSQVNTAISQATAQSFTVTNSAVAATDTIIVSQKSGTDKYEIFVTNVADGSFQITNYAVAGTTNEAPVFNFTVIKGVTS